VVRIGDTAVVCGVRAEILSTDDIAPWGVSPSTSNRLTTAKRRKAESFMALDGGEDENGDDDSEIETWNLLVPNLSLSTGCSPNFVPGAPPSPLAQSLSHQLLSLLHISRLVRVDDLRIWYQPPNLSEANNMGEDVDMDSDSAEHGDREIKAFWTLYIDLLVISLAGNLFDAAWAALLAALRDTRLPKAWWDMDSGAILCSDNVSESRKLRLRGLPVSSSFCVFEAHAAAEWRAVDCEGHRNGKGKKSDDHTGQERWILADPDAFEEALCAERICVVVDRDLRQAGRVTIMRLEKNGGVAVGRGEMRNLVNLAADRWDEWRAILDRLE
jgi:exosome complex component RRP43